MEITEEQKKLIKIMAGKFSNSGLSAADLYQEGLLALMRAHQTFREDTGVNFGAYATRCIKNRFIDLVRKRGEKVNVFIEEQVAGEGSFDDEIDLLEIKRALREQCTDIERAIFNSYIEGFSYDEMGKIFELPRKKIDNIIQKVKKIIKTLG